MVNSDEQANRTNSVAAAINELGAATQEIARNAADASRQASDAPQQAEGGRQVVERTMAAMNELSAKISDSCINIEQLNSKTTNIGQILEVIKGISEQTNLLALNAAIEAARGFAVVADEVRGLAQRTRASAQEIHLMIDELQVGAREAVTAMVESRRYSEQSVEIGNKAGERLGNVTRHIVDIDTMNQSVATAMEEQTAVVDSLNQDISRNRHPQPGWGGKSAYHAGRLCRPGASRQALTATGRQFPRVTRETPEPQKSPLSE